MAIPALIPVTTPLLPFTMAIVVLSLVHRPFCVPLLVNAIIDPVHTDDEPLIIPAVTAGFTLTVVVTVVVPQVFVTAYLMVVEPAVTPVTTPVT